VEQFSPGMRKWQKTSDSADSTRLYVNASANELFHIRDMSVLNSILSFVTIESTSVRHVGSDASRIRIIADGDIAADITYTLTDDAFVFAIDGITYELPLSEIEVLFLTDGKINDLENLRSLFDGGAWLERIDLRVLSEMLQTGELFKMLPGFMPGNVMTHEIYSDDGLRMNQLDVDGQFYFNGELWSVSGTIKEPDGKSPKDTAEFHFLKDEKNILNASMSSKYMQEKGQNGTLTSDCKINISGKINGYDVNYTIGIKMRNDWNADGALLSEKLTISPSVKWSNKIPDLKYLHLNNGSFTGKSVIQMVSNESSDIVSGGNSTFSVELKMDGENVISGTLGIRFETSEDSLSLPNIESVIDRATFSGLMESSLKEISKKIYQHIGEKTKKKTKQGI